MLGFQEGDERELKLSLDRDAAQRFVDWSGDNALLHTDDAYAKARGFERRIVHGAALFALVSQFVGVHFPGGESLWMGADVKFHNPCYAPCELTITGRISRISEATSSMTLAITVVDQRGAKLLSAKSRHRILQPA